MACRFPGADTVAQFWSNLSNGIESISTFSDETLRRAGVAPELISSPNYVKASASIDQIDQFDASFFGYTPREAATMDPQHRIFLECASEALESSGYDPARYTGAIGVFAGAGRNSYLGSSQPFTGSVDEYQTAIGNQHDFLATRISYKLNLTGPSVTIQSACSTSLVAVHMACQSLISGDSDIALAGGVSIRVPQQSGYLYQQGGILSPDAHCRAFDASSQGTVIGSGAGVVVLKRLGDALADGDCIYAVVKGSAINNDGAMKIGYTAPSAEGQVKVIRAAHSAAGVSAETISYVEAHGTGTALGDPIEISALTQAFRARTQLQGFCAIGSVKTNIGHLDTAAGVAGLIKTIVSLKERQIPPSLHFVEPNPQIDFASSPFYVNNRLRDWRTDSVPRRAGISAMGVGGTNAHVILEEAPEQEPSSGSRPWHLLVLSAKTPTALDRMAAQMADFIRSKPALDLANMAYTLQVGRQVFKHRRVLVCRDAADAAELLESGSQPQVLSAVADQADPHTVFLFPGQGSQYAQMAAGLYRDEPMFRDQIDMCAEGLKPYLGLDLRDVLFLKNGQDAEAAAAQLSQTWLSQPALFSIEYALAQLWISWGVHPGAMIGHSLGEYVAACVAGVFSLEDALKLIAARGRLMQAQPRGAMLAVPLPEQDVLPLLDAQLDIAAINAPSMCVVSGPEAAIAVLDERLSARGIVARRLHTSHAFHSASMEPALAPFMAEFASVELNEPQIPFISNVSGTWITADEATDPQYWARHLRQAVRFSDGVRTLLETPNLCFLEVGPGRTLSTLVRQHLGPAAGSALVTSLRHPDDPQNDQAYLLRAIGQLWMAGVSIDWDQVYVDEVRRRVRLPTYPFERQRYWVEQRQSAASVAAPVLPEMRMPAAQAPADPSPAPAPRRAGLSRFELVVAQVWQDLLGITSIRAQDNFFELGGDSLTAIHMLSKVGQALGINLPSHCLFQSPTVAALASECAKLAAPIPAPEPKRPAALVEMRKGDGRRPLFMVHPIGGGVYVYRDLVRALDANQPFYGLQAHDEEAPVGGVAAMAERYIAAIRTVQPKGPYLIGGFSFGGVVAFEMAQQLRASGEQVDLLTLIDTPWPKDVPADLDVDRAAVEMIFAALPDVQQALDRIWQCAPEQRLQACLEHAHQIHLFPKEFDLAALQEMFERLKAHVVALRGYEAQPYDGKVLFFTASERPADVPPNPQLGWAQVASTDIAIRRVGGDHMGMMGEPHVGKIAYYLQQMLDTADTAAAPKPRRTAHAPVREPAMFMGFPRDGGLVLCA